MTFELGVAVHIRLQTSKVLSYPLRPHGSTVGHGYIVSTQNLGSGSPYGRHMAGGVHGVAIMGVMELEGALQGLSLDVVQDGASRLCMDGTAVLSCSHYDHWDFTTEQKRRLRWLM